MKFDEVQTEEFEAAARPMMEFLAKNCHPHTVALVDCDSAQVLESQATYASDEFVQD